MKLHRLPAIFILVCFAGFGFIACNPEEKEGSTKTTTADDVTAKNIELTKSFYTMFEKSDWAGIEKVVAPNMTDHGPMMPPGSAFNRDSLMKYLKANKEAFPDMKFEVLSTAASGDLVFVQYRFTGTNSGPLMGMPATGKKVDYTGVDLVRIKDGIATEHWDYGDNITYMKQMGLMPQQ